MLQEVLKNLVKLLVLLLDFAQLTFSGSGLLNLVDNTCCII